MQGAVIAKNINLSNDVAANVPFKVVGDRCRVEHVLSNLLSNAIKFSTPGKSINVNVSLESMSNLDNGDSSALISIKVTDEGFHMLHIKLIIFTLVT